MQRHWTIGLMALGLVWVIVWMGLGHPIWALVGPAVGVFLLAAILGAELLLTRRTFGPDDRLRPEPFQLLRAWLGEIGYALLVFGWRQPFRSEHEPDSLEASLGSSRGVLLVHGFLCNRGIWNPWMRSLRRAGVPFVAVNLEPVFGSIDGYVSAIDKAVRRLEGATGSAPVIVAHSMGGLAARAWLGKHPDRAARVHRVVTVGTPHAGTVLARRARTCNGGQMAPDSAWLRGIAAHEGPTLRRLFVCFYGHCDNVVIPMGSAILADARAQHLPASAHVQMLFHPSVFEEVLRLVASATAADGEARGRGQTPRPPAPTD